MLYPHLRSVKTSLSVCVGMETMAELNKIKQEKKDYSRQAVGHRQTSGGADGN